MEPSLEEYLDFIRSIKPESRLRLAPTPSGFLHVGNAFNFILQCLALNGPGNTSRARLYLRIDDLDADRKRPEYIADIFDAIRQLGLDLLLENPPYYQTERVNRYHERLDQLRAKGVLFACRKSRKELEPFGGVYPEAFRNQGLSLDDPDVAWRIKTPPGFPMPDFVVRRRDGIPAYQIASLVDELDMGITHVIRGEDLRSSTQAQQFLAEILEAPDFFKIRFYHHPLLQGSDGEKLSKSAGATALKSIFEQENGKEQVFRNVGDWLGAPSSNSLDSLQKVLSRLLP